MAGHFELFTDDRSYVRFRLVAPDGTVLAVSGPFDDKKAVAAAIADLRECAGTGLVEDRSLTADTRAPVSSTSSFQHRNQRLGKAAKATTVALPGSGKDAAGMDGFTLESEAVGEVLADMAVQAVTCLSLACSGVSCGFSVFRPKKTAVFGGSGLVRVLDELQGSLGGGPGLAASTGQGTVVVRDLACDGRWPQLAGPAAEHGIRSVLAVPVPAGGGVSTVLTVCVDRPDAFDSGDVLAAEEFAMEASRILRPALRIAELKDTLQNLHAALEHRSVIDTALGVVMAQNRCDHDAAFKILMRAARTRNVKLRDVAATVLASVSGEPLRVHFDP